MSISRCTATPTMRSRSRRWWAGRCTSCWSIGLRDVRNQGVLLRGVNATAADLVELCFMMLDHAKIMPYYFYMCDMIPNAEHWRLGCSRRSGSSTISWDTCPDSRRRGWSAMCRSSASAGSTRSPSTIGSGDLLLDEELPHLDRGNDPAALVADLRVLRSDLSAARVRPGVVAGYTNDPGTPRSRRQAADPANAEAADRALLVRRSKRTVHVGPPPGRHSSIRASASAEDRRRR